MGAICCLEAARSAVVTGRARAIIMSGRMFAMVVDCGIVELIVVANRKLKINRGLECNQSECDWTGTYIEHNFL